MSANGIVAVFAIGFISGAAMVVDRPAKDVAHPDIIQEAAQITADCIDKQPMTRSFAKQHCMAEWSRILDVEYRRP